MPHTPVAADLGQPLDVHGQIPAEVALHGIAVTDDLTELGLLGLGQILYPGVGVDPGFRQDLVGAGAPDAEDISQTDLDPLVSRQVNSRNTSHTVSAPP